MLNLFQKRATTSASQEKSGDYKVKNIENSKYMVFCMYPDYPRNAYTSRSAGLTFFDTEEEAVAHAKKVQVGSSYPHYVGRTPHIKVQSKKPEVEAIYL